MGSSSVESNSSSWCKLSSSPAGFWHVRPGLDVETTDNNHGWSPSTSPVNSFLLDNAMRRHKSSITSKGDNSVTGNNDIFILDPPIVENLGSSTMAKKQSIGSVPVPGGGLNHANTLGRVDEDYEQYHVYY